MHIAFDAVLEILTWVALAGAFVCGLCTVVAWAADGTWLPARGYLDREDGSTWVRWYDADGDANAARLEPADADRLAGVQECELFSRHGWRDRMRFTRTSALVRGAGRLTLILTGVGVASAVGAIVLMFVRG